MASAAPTSTSTARRQSTRQVRASTTRPQNYFGFSRTLTGSSNNAVGANSASASTGTAQQQPGFCPAITHFTDAVDALPKEVMRHFSMLREVEAKLLLPDEELGRLANAIDRLPSRLGPHAQLLTAGAPSTIQASNSSAPNGVPAASNPSQNGAVVFHQQPDHASLHSQLLLRLNYSIKSMTPALDEKIAVLSTASNTLSRQLERMKSSYKHVNNEISAEARIGSLTHWAYTAEKEPKKAAGTERTRREVAAAAAAAAAGNGAAEGDLAAAARSEARREAMLAKKGRQANAQLESDFDERPPPKRNHAKGRKPADLADGKSSGAANANGAAPGKRRKVANTTSGERTVGGNSNKKAMASPRVVPVNDGGKKRKPPGPVPGKKRLQNAGTASPKVASSPVVGTLNAKDHGPKAQKDRSRQNSHPTIAPQVPALDLSRSKQTPSTSAKATNGILPPTEKPPANNPMLLESQTNSSETVTGDTSAASALSKTATLLNSTAAISSPLLSDPASTKLNWTSQPAATDLSLPSPTTLTAPESQDPHNPSPATTKDTTTDPTAHTLPNSVSIPNTVAAPNNTATPTAISGGATSATTTTTLTRPSRASASKTATPTLGAFPDAPFSAPPSRNSRNRNKDKDKDKDKDRDRDRDRDTPGSNNSGGGTSTAGGSAPDGVMGVSAGAGVGVGVPSGVPERPASGSRHKRRRSAVTKDKDGGAGGGANAQNGSGNGNGRKKAPEGRASSPRADGRVNARGPETVDGEEVGRGREAEAEGEGEGEGEEDDEPRYCYCNDFSYGEMVACDNEACPREWFHLKCVGMTKAPEEDSKWFCDQCKGPAVPNSSAAVGANNAGGGGGSRRRLGNGRRGAD